jgi:hypothetical protein
VIRLLTTVSSKRYGNLCNLSRDFMQIRIRHLYRAAPETAQRATHAFAGPIENMGIDHRGFDIVAAQEFLYGSDIINVLHKG